MIALILCILATAIILVGVQLYRKKNPEFSLKNNEIFLALLPLILYGLLSGRIQRLEFAGLKVYSEFQKAINTRITKRDIIPIVPIEIEKEPLRNKHDLPRLSERLLRKRPNALKLTLRKDRTKYPICDYIDALTESPTFRYVVFVDSLDDFKALIPVSSIAANLTTGGECEAESLINYIQEPKKYHHKIRELPGLVLDYQAASPSWEKRRCLEEMHYEKNDAIPVVEEDKLVGVIEKSYLVASIIIDVSAAIKY